MHRRSGRVFSGLWHVQFRKQNAGWFWLLWQLHWHEGMYVCLVSPYPVADPNNSEPLTWTGGPQGCVGWTHNLKEGETEHLCFIKHTLQEQKQASTSVFISVLTLPSASLFFFFVRHITTTYTVYSCISGNNGQTPLPPTPRTSLITSFNIIDLHSFKL